MVAEPTRFELLVAEHVSAVPVVSAVNTETPVTVPLASVVVVPHCEVVEAIPDAAVMVQVTVTLLTYQPLEPGVPVI